MTQDEIIEMARKSGLTKFVGNYDQSFALEAFAKLVAQHEREACIDIVAMFGGSIEIEAAIRARGKA